MKPGGGDICGAESGCQAGSTGAAAGAVARPTELGVDESDDVYVADLANNRVSEFFPTGEFLHAFGEGVASGAAAFELCWTTCQAGGQGTVPGATPMPMGLDVDCQGSVYVAEYIPTYVTGGPFARIERFGEATTPPPPCHGEPTGGTVQPPPVSSPAKTITISRRIWLAGLRRNLRNGTAVLFVKVRVPGRLILHGRGVRRLVRGVRRAGRRVRLPIKPKVRLRHFLKHHRKGAIRVNLTLRPADGSSPASIEKRVVLKRRHHHR